MNRLAALTPDVRTRGVVAFSSGNHAQGVAAAAKILGMPAAIVMPADAPANKVARTKALGAEVIFYDRATQDRIALANMLAQERNAVLVPSYDDPYIIAGQGTAGLEMAEDCQRLGIIPDLFLCCTGGGGLISGCTLALKEIFPALEVIAVEPAHYDDVGRSLAAGKRLGIEGFAPTLCDALQTPMVGALTFPLLQKARAHGLSVCDTKVLEAMAFAFEHLKLVLEPGGAVALAAALSNAIDLKGKTVLVMLSGGNVDAEIFAQCLDYRKPSLNNVHHV
jgi:threonine dehydratase